MKPFAAAVAAVLADAREKYPNIHSKHEALGLVIEQVEELKRSIFNNRGSDSLAKEFIELGAVCQRAGEDLNLT